MIVTLISGGLESKQALASSLHSATKTKMKVMFFSKDSFDKMYGKKFKQNFPQVEFEVIDLNPLNTTKNDTHYEQELNKLINKHKPDLIWFGTYNNHIIGQKLFSQYAKEGKWSKLDSLIMQDNFNFNTYMPGYVEMIRQYGNGSIYGLATSLLTDIVSTNKEVVKADGIELPQLKMSWKQLMALSNQFSTVQTDDKQIYVIPHHSITKYYPIAQPQMPDFTEKKWLSNAKQWQQAVQSVADNVKKQGMFTYSDWNQATGNSTHILMKDMFVILNESKNKEIAWEFLKFINTPQLKSTSVIEVSSMPVNDVSLQQVQTKQANPFYFIMAKSTPNTLQVNTMPHHFFTSFKPLLTQEMKSLLHNKKKVKNKTYKKITKVISGEGNRKEVTISSSAIIYPN